MWPAPLASGGLALGEVACGGWDPHLQYSLLIKLASLSGKYDEGCQGKVVKGYLSWTSTRSTLTNCAPVSDRGQKIYAKSVSGNDYCACAEPILDLYFFCNFHGG